VTGRPFFFCAISVVAGIAMRPIVLLVMLATLSCDREDRPRPPTAAESEQLNEVDEMLDRLANEEGPEAEASSPSERPE
jgi:hypothetical protein